jgi:hypothetical protein
LISHLEQGTEPCVQDPNDEESLSCTYPGEWQRCFQYPPIFHVTEWLRMYLSGILGGILSSLHPEGPRKEIHLGNIRGKREQQLGQLFCHYLIGIWLVLSTLSNRLFIIWPSKKNLRKFLSPFIYQLLYC